MSISIARKIAFDVLLRVTTQDAYADEALRALLVKTVSVEDAGLATELSLGTLRWQRLLDFLIDGHLTKLSKSLDPEVRIALRLGSYQLHFLTRVPSRAAVHESVELVKLARKRSAAPLVNAVLRKIANESARKTSPGDTIAALLPSEISLADRLGIQHSHPTWLVERWLRSFGEQRTRSLLEANNRVPPLAGYLLDPRHRDGTLSALQEAGCVVRPGNLLSDSWTLERGNPAASEAARRGWLAVQDEASQAVARLVGVEPGNFVLDLCAAPGGKTLRLALDTGPNGRVIAADLHAHRVRAMAERLERAGIQNVETLTLDATSPLPTDPPFHRRFDRILVDVPCSGTGTLARHPEIRWRLRQEDLQAFHARQAALLRNALPHLAPEGRLVYSTCSLEPEENELVVKEVLGSMRNSLRIVSPRKTIEPFLRESVNVESIVDANGFFRTFPPEHRTDGFFAAVIE
jgi:16S rRNA (cytosine967-C5)-methyltransferase